jgi:signal transduction histidine kinase
LKLKTQFLLSILIFVILLAALSLSITTIDMQLSQLHSDLEIANTIQTDIATIFHISNSYLLFQEQAQVNLWQAKFSSIHNNLTQIQHRTPQRQFIIKEIENNMKKLNATFTSIELLIENIPSDQNFQAHPDFQSKWVQLIDLNIAIVFDSGRLSEDLLNQDNYLLLLSSLLIVSLLGLFTVYFFLNYLLMYRRTLRTISKLQTGTAIVGSGNLDYTIKAERQDEIGELSRAFNTMTANLKSATTKLQQQERMAAIGQTAGMVGHDLRNPLQAIMGELYLAKKELDELQESTQKTNLQESIQAIEEQISYMDKIVSDLQTFVKPIEVHKQTTLLKDLTIDVIDQISVPANVKVTLQMDDSLTVNADPQLLKRVLINLVTNAVQAMPNGGELNIKAHNTSDRIQIIVQDTGTGIPNKIKPQIFTPLFTTKPKGQGFGLAVCKKVIEAQGGKITYESQEGKGTKFIIELPLTN